jgi:hypothetical protein
MLCIGICFFTRHESAGLGLEISPPHHQREDIPVWAKSQGLERRQAGGRGGRRIGPIGQGGVQRNSGPSPHSIAGYS